MRGDHTAIVRVLMEFDLLQRFDLEPGERERLEHNRELTAYRFADRNAENIHGQTPSHVAVVFGAENALGELLVGHDPDADNEGGLDADTVVEHTDSSDDEGDPGAVVADAPAEEGIEDAGWYGYIAPVAAMLEPVTMTVGDYLNPWWEWLRNHDGNPGGADAREERLRDPRTVYLGIQDKAGQTILQCAAMAGHEGIIRVLLAQGAVAHVQDLQGRTALHLAAERGHVPTAQALLGLDGDTGEGQHRHRDDRLIVIVDEDNRNALHLAAGAGHYQMVVFLLGVPRVHLHAVDGGGNTPLHLAAGAGYLHCVEQLCATERGLVDMTNYAGQTALARAAEGGHLEVARYLRGTVRAQIYIPRERVECIGGRRVSLLSLAVEDAQAGRVRGRNQRWDSALHYAAREGHLTIAELFLQRAEGVAAGEGDARTGEVGVVDIQAADRRTPLHLAAAAGQHEMVGVLLAHGANPIARDDAGNTPLHLAAEGGYTLIVAALYAAVDEREGEGLEDGEYGDTATAAGRGKEEEVVGNAVLAATNDRGETLLHLAATAGRGRYEGDLGEDGEQGLVGFLLDRGAPVDAVDGRGDTPLHRAAEGGHADIVRHLLVAGANRVAVNLAGDTPIHRAAENDHGGIWGDLLRGANTEVINARAVLPGVAEGSTTPGSSRASTPRVLRRSLSLSPRPVGIRRASMTASPSTRYLPRRRRSGASQDSPLQGGQRTPRVEELRGPLFRLGDTTPRGIPEAPEDQTAADGLGDTPLLRACRHGRINAARGLIRRRANMLCRVNGDGVTVLHLAVHHPELLELLLTAGGDAIRSLINADERDNGGDTDIVPRMVGGSPGSDGSGAGYYVHMNVGEVREDNDAETRACTPLRVAAQLGHADAISLLLRHGANPNIRDADEMTPLAHAAQRGHLAAVEVLLGHGNTPARALPGWMTGGARRALVDVDRSTDNGRTPLDRAVTEGHVAVVELLLNRGAGVRTATGNNLRTPLHRAAYWGNLEIVRLLLDHGADVHAQAANHETAIHRAIFGGQPDDNDEARAERRAIINLLRQRGADIDTIVERDTARTRLHQVLDNREGGLNANNERARALLVAGANPNFPDNQGITPVEIAAMQGNDEMVRVLVEDYGADVTQVDQAALGRARGLADETLRLLQPPAVEPRRGFLETAGCSLM